MKAALQRLQDRRLWPLWLLLLAAVVLLPGLGSHGFLEPHEIAVADEARKELEKKEKEGGEAGEKKAPARVQREEQGTGPPLTHWLVTRGIDVFGVSELGARLPLALLGLIAVIATYFIGLRLASPRAGLFGALVLLCAPLFLFQARHLNSDVGAVTGSALVVLGLVGLATRDRGHLWSLAGDALDALWIAGGSVLSYFAAGAFLGLVVPLGGVALACLAYLGADRAAAGERERHPWPIAAAGGLALTGCLGALAWLFVELYDFVGAYPGDRALFGQTIEASRGYVDALGGTWRPDGNTKVTFNALVEQIAFGLFPWSAIAPIALLRLAVGERRGRAAWAGYVVFAWALLAWIVATVMARKVTMVHYPALAALAVACGIWADDMLKALGGRSEGEAEAEGDRQERAWPLVGLFAFLAAVVLSKDLVTFPQELTSLNLTGTTLKYPDKLHLHLWIPVFGGLFGAALLLALAIRRPAEEGWKYLRAALEKAYQHRRAGLLAAVAAALLFALFLVFAWTPGLSRKLSSKHIFSVYQELKEPGDRLGLQGRHGSGPEYYAGGDYEKLSSRRDLLDFLGRDERVFALAQASQLCPVHKAAADGDFSYYVLDDSHARYILMSNRLREGETDKNPLATAIVRERPEGIKQPLDVNFDDKVRLIGVDMPRRVDRGDTFEVTLYFEVLQRVGRNWKIFAHFDGGGMRFQGDHDPIKGRCGTAYWQPGDYIVDTFEVEAGGMTFAKTNYRAWVGFFVGSHGNWTNMPVKSGKHDAKNRVPVGVIQVR